MPQVKPHVVLLTYTKDPAQTIAMSAKLCYSDELLFDYFIKKCGK